MCEVVRSPIYGVFIQGPKNIIKMYNYEVWGREKIEKRGLLRYRLFALWRGIGEETKGIISGITNTFVSTERVFSELISIFFGD
ncbi:MAG: hypothetical protein NC820_06525 [Candidatus Omnitrophica bacterium]|nr:hypothetical protein [Candidatus Omnitrophota bacterium]